MILFVCLFIFLEGSFKNSGVCLPVGPPGMAVLVSGTWAKHGLLDIGQQRGFMCLMKLTVSQEARTLTYGFAIS